ncbi:metalloregulator ArsR/SmtB family transcription factor [Phenylobacterium sp.]|uniref:metalloregulator ArsR/SmtB family transcription factor n=1 Tax=Phenylobacterium sp. TaxID=1871053 RepID=UPI00301DFCF2
MAIAALSALAHEGRMAVFRLLVRAGPAGMPAGEIARAAGMLANTLSSNLSILVAAGLVTSRREGRSVIYAAVYGEARRLLEYLVDDCCGGRPEICAALPPAAPLEAAPRPAIEAVFVCAGDPARAVLAAALMNTLSDGRFHARAATLSGQTRANPHVEPLLRALGVEEGEVAPVPVANLTGPDAPPLAFAITVCAEAARAPRTVWPGQPITAQWDIPDPAAATGTPAEMAAAFREAARRLRNRIELLLALPMEKLDRLALHARTYEIGRGTDLADGET